MDINFKSYLHLFSFLKYSEIFDKIFKGRYISFKEDSTNKSNSEKKVFVVRKEGNSDESEGDCVYSVPLKVYKKKDVEFTSIDKLCYRLIELGLTYNLFYLKNRSNENVNYFIYSLLY